jgi:hypothetical protein
LWKNRGVTYLDALLELQVEGFRVVRDAEGFERPIEHEIAEASASNLESVGIDWRGTRVYVRQVEPTGRFGSVIVEARP